MKIIRIGNDIHIEWTITRFNDPEVFTGKTVSVILYDKNNVKQKFDYTISGNVISGYFYGKDQYNNGTYRLLLVENEGQVDMVSLDYIDAFVLSNKLKNQTFIGGDSAGNINTEVISVASEINLSGNGGGDLSNYVTKQELDEASYVSTYSLDEMSYISSYDLNECSYITMNDVSACGYLTSVPSEYITQDELSACGYLTSVPSDLVTYSYLDNNYLKLENFWQEQVSIGAVVWDPESQTYGVNRLASISYVETILNNASYATQSYVQNKIDSIPSVDLSAYVTKTELNNAGYISSIPSEYITQAELSGNSYLTSVPNDYPTYTAISNMGYLTSSVFSYDTTTGTLTITIS